MPTDCPPDVGSEIRAEMGRQRVSMLKLSGQTNIARTTLAHQINNGRVTVDTLVAIAKALGKEPADFLPADRAEQSGQPSTVSTPDVREPVALPKCRPCDVERFWSKVNKDGPTAEHMDTPCWLWTDSPASNGYGLFWLNPRKVLAHRLSYELVVGPIPHGLQVDHRCFVRTCVNPQHLRPATNQQNGQNRKRIREEAEQAALAARSER